MSLADGVVDVRDYPTLRSIDAVPADESPLSGGHLWLREFVDGGALRFTMTGSGLLRFGDAGRTFGDEVPLSYRAAARHVRQSFDRDALRGAVDDPESVTFFGVATRLQSVPYDFDRLPPFLGTEVARGAERLPIDAVERILPRLGLSPVDAVAKEVHVRDFHPARYEFPGSNWYDGPVAGVVVRNRDGTRALLPNPAVRDADGDGDGDGATDAFPPGTGTWTGPDPDPDPTALVEQFLTPERVRTLADEAGDADVSTLAERLVEALVREQYARLYARPSRFDPDAVRAAARRRASRLLGEEG